jgi:hypothetical protein
MADYAGRRLLAALEEGNAEEQAAAQALLRDVLPSAPPEDWDPSPYIRSQHWVTARTGDHDYVVIRYSTDWREHLRFLRWLRAWGTVERFKGARYRYRDVGDHHYWAMVSPNDTIANRREQA